ncbi:MAG: 23S rRNA (uracil(1939)-C(5))-methyltransferase RlmD [Bacteroidetes bacterium]|nr:23S rRNA (uracil(1939)-C(5))-methyltransferase RlmD [Bacteroidota bacterium]
MRIKNNIIRNIRVESVAAEGKGIGKNNGQVIFISGTAPGDLVDVRILKKKKNYLEAVPLKFHELSDKRVEPFCYHFGQCGGCKWQHLNYESQLEIKQQQVIDQLERIGKVQIPRINPIIASDKTQLYRNKLEYTFTNRRWLTKEEIETGEDINRSGLGFHMPGRFDRVLDIDHCYLLPEPSNELRLFMKFFAINNNLTFYDVYSHSGLLRNLIIRVTDTGEIMVIIQFGENNPDKIRFLMDEVNTSFPEITSLNYVVNTKKNDTFYDLEVKNYAGTQYITETMDDIHFRIGPKSFFQTNTSQALKLYRTAREFAGLTGNEVVYDLYCGAGTISNFIARNARRVIGLEHIEEAVNDAKINSEINNIENTEFYCGDIKDNLNAEFFSTHGNPDVIITDPPRAGMHKDVVKALIASEANKIVYISCNPATQARDIELMTEYYNVLNVQPVDMFPHTQHVENVVLLQQK